MANHQIIHFTKEGDTLSAYAIVDNIMGPMDQGPAQSDRMSTCQWSIENHNLQLTRHILAIVPADFSVSWKVVHYNMTWYTRYIPLLGRRGRLWAAILSPSDHPILLMFCVCFHSSAQIRINRQVLISLRNNFKFSAASHPCAPVSGSIQVEHVVIGQALSRRSTKAHLK